LQRPDLEGGAARIVDDLEKDKERERLMQLESMEAEVNKFKVAKAQGNMADLMRAKRALPAQLEKYLEDIKADEGEGMSSDVTGKWRKAALDLTKDAVEYLSGLGRGVEAAEEDALGPLRRAIGKVATLSEAVSKEVLEPDEGELRDLAKKLGAVKKELMTMGRELMVNQPRLQPQKPTSSSATRRGCQSQSENDKNSSQRTGSSVGHIRG
jgi:hypothetical protein